VPLTQRDPVPCQRRKFVKSWFLSWKNDPGRRAGQRDRAIADEKGWAVSKEAKHHRGAPIADR
jgi:hypothetical protein